MDYQKPSLSLRTAVLASLLLCSSAFAQVAPGTNARVGAIIEKANLMARNGIPARRIDAWIKSQLATVKGAEMQGAPPAWDAYARAAWMQDGTGSAPKVVRDAFAMATSHVLPRNEADGSTRERSHPEDLRTSVGRAGKSQVPIGMAQRIPDVHEKARQAYLPALVVGRSSHRGHQKTRETAADTCGRGIPGARTTHSIFVFAQSCAAATGPSDREVR